MFPALQASIQLQGNGYMRYPGTSDQHMAAYKARVCKVRISGFIRRNFKRTADVDRSLLGENEIFRGLSLPTLKG